MDILILLLRLIHIVGGAFWVGAALALAFFVEPIASAAGPAGSQFMQRFGQSKFGIVVSIAAVLTIVAGVLLFGLRGWTLTEPKGLTFGIGGLVSLIALIYGGAITGPTSAKLGRLGAEIQAGGAPPTPEQMRQMQEYQARLGQASRMVAVLVTIAIILMAVARYL